VVHEHPLQKLILSFVLENIQQNFANMKRWSHPAVFVQTQHATLHACYHKIVHVVVFSAVLVENIGQVSNGASLWQAFRYQMDQRVVLLRFGKKIAIYHVP
jgi:hypothetical protein